MRGSTGDFASFPGNPRYTPGSEATRIAAKKASGPSADELVTKALLTLAAADGPVRLSGKGDPPALFPSATKASKDALARLQDEGHPLLVVVGSGKTATVRLTAAGFRHVLPHLPEETVGGSAKALAAELPPGERVEFLNEVVRRTPPAAPELLPVLEEAVAAEKAEAEARAASAARRRQAEEATRQALDRWNRLLAERQAHRVAALRRELEAEGETVGEHVGASPTPQVPTPAAPLPRPESAEDVGFRRQVARRLVSSWLEAVEGRKEEARRFLETAIGNVSGLRQVGEPGERVTFDGAYHEGGAGLFTGTPVRVVRPGWVLEEEDDREYPVLKALVAQ
jgi:hypothetical protein